MKKIIFFISLCLHGCAFWGDNVNGEKYKVNKLILIDGNYFEYVSLPEKCQNKLEQNGWNLSKNYEECPHFVKGRIDTLIYSFNAKYSSLCDERKRCVAKPDIFMSEDNKIYISFCSKFYTQMSYDSMNVIRDFVNGDFEWGGKYQFVKSDSLLILQGLSNKVKMFFFLDDKRVSKKKNSVVGKDVSRYMRKPYGIVRDSVCFMKGLVIF